MRPRRKNYFPTFVLIAVLWSLLALMIILIEPNLIKDILIPGSYLPFWLIFFPAVFFTSAIVWGNSRRGLLTTIGICLYLLLQIFGFGNFLNLILIFGMLIAVDRHFN